MAYLSQMQGNGLNDTDTILEQFYEVGFKNYGEVRRYISMYGFSEDILKQNITSLSGGERNILQLAKVSASKANMLLLDEPTSAADSKGRILINNLIGQYCEKTGCTLIMTTHTGDYPDFKNLRIIELYDGKILNDTKAGNTYDA